LCGVETQLLLIGADSLVLNVRPSIARPRFSGLSKGSSQPHPICGGTGILGVATVVAARVVDERASAEVNGPVRVASTDRDADPEVAHSRGEELDIRELNAVASRE
jgi:hypothetical protein